MTAIMSTMSVSSTSCPHCAVPIEMAELLAFTARVSATPAGDVFVHRLCQLECEQAVGWASVSEPLRTFRHLHVVEAANVDAAERAERRVAALRRRPISDRQRVMLHRNTRSDSYDGTTFAGGWE